MKAAGSNGYQLSFAWKSLDVGGVIDLSLLNFTLAIAQVCKGGT